MGSGYQTMGHWAQYSFLAIFRKRRLNQSLSVLCLIQVILSGYFHSGTWVMVFDHCVQLFCFLHLISRAFWFGCQYQ